MDHQLLAVEGDHQDLHMVEVDHQDLLHLEVLVWTMETHKLLTLPSDVRNREIDFSKICTAERS
ncbi:MAG: hypothetical protein AAGA83_23435 [Cyanobacteria bacterium P01_F01_bin.116]